MDLGLGDKVALVGGASRGLGKASALALAQEGARVAICARDREALEASAQEIRERTGGEVLAIAGDLSSSEGVEQVVAGTVEQFGGPGRARGQLGRPGARASSATSTTTPGARASRS